jgi:hypothetical protein
MCIWASLVPPFGDAAKKNWGFCLFFKATDIKPDTPTSCTKNDHVITGYSRRAAVATHCNATDADGWGKSGYGTLFEQSWP